MMSLGYKYLRLVFNWQSMYRQRFVQKCAFCISMNLNYPCGRGSYEITVKNVGLCLTTLYNNLFFSYTCLLYVVNKYVSC